MGHTLAFSSTRKHPRTAIGILPTGNPEGLSIKFDGEILTKVLYEACNLTNTPSRQLVLVDENGATFYTGPTFTNDGAAILSPTGGLEMDGTYTVKTVLAGGLSGATGGTGPATTDYLTMFVR